MTTAFITHPACVLHDMGGGHPECPERLGAIENQLKASGLLESLQRHEAPRAERKQIERIHEASYVEKVLSYANKRGHAYLDPDTMIMSESPEAALRAAGAMILATELVLDKKADNAFCNVRPPGHHALSDHAMGFCFFNNIAVGAAHAMAEYGLTRVAICDFDVHHGNGTEAVFDNDSRVMLCSSFQHPFYPLTPINTHNPNIIDTPLPAGASSDEFREAVTAHWLPALRRFAPEMVFVSAGFDAHYEDMMSQVRLHTEDYIWITEQIVEIAKEYAQGRIVSALEGGYALPALGHAAAEHINTLLNC
ncbi:MAG: histone deacetylase family protein [Gammaproteobacteria bacterium]|nr:histone deacetylase family protein [Gammaproteobacteria bacterium]